MSPLSPIYEFIALVELDNTGDDGDGDDDDGDNTDTDLDNLDDDNCNKGGGGGGGKGGKGGDKLRDSISSDGTARMPLISR